MKNSSKYFYHGGILESISYCLLHYQGCHPIHRMNTWGPFTANVPHLVPYNNIFTILRTSPLESPRQFLLLIELASIAIAKSSGGLK